MHDDVLIEKGRLEMQKFYTKLSTDKIKINWNKNPIKMATFLRFLTVPVTKSRDHLGACNGWTLYENEDLKLHISGGIVNGTEYLDNIRYGNRLQNPYNNYVNPFYLFEILTEEGRLFFTEYYREDVSKLIAEQGKKVIRLESGLRAEKTKHELFISEAKTLGITGGNNE